MACAGGVTIVAAGHCLPGHVEDNFELCRNLDVSPEWVVEKTGIQRRLRASTDECASDYAATAARRAMARAGITPADVGLIICCTFSGDYLFPPLSAKVHHLLGGAGAQIFDIQANCAGFVTGLTVAAERMRSEPEMKFALVIGVEMCSRYIDSTDVNTAIYLSDGAGAVVLGRSASGYGLLASDFFTDTSNYEAVRLRGGGSSFPINGRPFDRAVDLMEMNGIATWKQAITHLPRVIRGAARKAGVEVASLDFLLFHQANLRLIEYLVRKLGHSMGKTFTNVQDIGNTGSASLAIATSEAMEYDLLPAGGLVLLAGVGAGFNFAASIWRWGKGDVAVC